MPCRRAPRRRQSPVAGYPVTQHPARRAPGGRGRPGAQRSAAGKLGGVGLTNDELIRRYQAGESLGSLAAAAEMALSGVQARLRRLGVPPRRKPSTAASFTAEQIGAALEQHQSINATAKALGVTRGWLSAEAQRLGLRRSFEPPGDLLERYHAGATQAQLADHYQTATSTVGHWLHALGEPAPTRGPRPRDG
jgi:hypothetical protein